MKGTQFRNYFVDKKLKTLSINNQICSKDCNLSHKVKFKRATEAVRLLKYFYTSSILVYFLYFQTNKQRLFNSIHT